MKENLKEMSGDLKYEKENIELRRGKVLELLAQGLRQKEIAEKLNVSGALISLDIQYIREKSKKDLESHFQDRLPYEYARSMAGINATLKRASEMLDEAKDPKTKIECMKLQMELWKSVMSMATDGGIIQQALKIVKGLEREDKYKVKMSSDEGEEVLEDEEDLEDEEITVNDEEEMLREEEEELPKEQ